MAVQAAGEQKTGCRTQGIPINNARLSQPIVGFYLFDGPYPSSLTMDWFSCWGERLSCE